MKTSEQQVMDGLELLGTYILRWRRDPVAYVIEACHDLPTHQQAAVMRALSKHKFVAVRSGHGIGKTKLLAWLTHWYLDCFRNPMVACRVPITGPTAGGLSDIVWSEVGNVLKNKLPWLASKYSINQEKMVNNESPNDWFAVMRTARKESSGSMQGFHQCFFIMDEGSDIPDEVFEVVQGAMGDEGSMAIMTGNPVKNSGYFFDVFKKRKTIWRRMHCPSTDSLTDTEYSYPFSSPTGELLNIKVRGRQTRSWVQGWIDEHGINSNAYKRRVLGEFTSGDMDTLLQVEWLDRAFGRTPPVENTRQRILGVDPARYGDDDTALVLRQGNVVMFAEKFHGLDGVEVAQRAASRHREYHFDRIMVDVIGIGTSAFDTLRHMGLPVVPVTVSNNAPDDNDSVCATLRDWLWWRARRFYRTMEATMDGKQDMPIWKQLAEELATPCYWYDVKGRVKVESKDDLKARGVMSPNLADALNLTFMFDFDRPGLAMMPRESERKKKFARPRSWATA